MSLEIPIQIVLIRETEFVQKKMFEFIPKCENNEDLENIKKMISRYIIDDGTRNYHNIMIGHILRNAPEKYWRELERFYTNEWKKYQN